MNRFLQIVRWAPVAYYAFATAWGMLIGGSELTDVLTQVGTLGAVAFLGLAVEQSSTLAQL